MRSSKSNTGAGLFVRQSAADRCGGRMRRVRTDGRIPHVRAEGVQVREVRVQLNSELCSWESSTELQQLLFIKLLFNNFQEKFIKLIRDELLFIVELFD